MRTPSAILAAALLWTAHKSAGAAAPVTALAFAPDGSALISGGSQALDIRSSTDGRRVGQLPCDLAKVRSLAFTPDGRCLAVAGGTPGAHGWLIIYDWPTRTERRRVEIGADLATDVAFNAQGDRIAVAGADHQVRTFRLVRQDDRGVEVETDRAWTAHAGPVLGVDWSPAGDDLVTVSADRSVKVWSAGQTAPRRSFAQHTDLVQALAFRPRSVPAGHPPPPMPPVVCATGGDDRTVRIWQPEIGRMVRIVRRHDGPILALAYAPDGRALFSAGTEGVVRSLDPDSDQILAETRVSGDWIYSLAVHPDGTVLAWGDWAGNVGVHPLPLPACDPPPTP